MLSGMAGATLGIWVAHGEGNVKFLKDGALKAALKANLAPVRYVDDDNVPTTTYGNFGRFNFCFTLCYTVVSDHLSRTSHALLCPTPCAPCV